MFYDLKNKQIVNFYFKYDSIKKRLFIESNKKTPGKILRGVNIFKEKEKNKYYVFNSEINISDNYLFEGVYILDHFNLKKLEHPSLNKIPIHSFSTYKDNFIASSHNTIYICNEKELLIEKQLNLKEGKIYQTKIFKNKLYFLFINKEDGLRSLFNYDFQKDVLTNISKELNIKSPVSDFLFDKENNLWVTTYGQGVFQILDIKNSFLGSSSFYNPDLRDLVHFKQNIFTIAPNIIYKIDSNDNINSKRVPFFTETLHRNSKNNLTVIMPGEVNKNYSTILNDSEIKSNYTKKFIFKNKSRTISIQNTDFVIYDKGVKILENCFTTFPYSKIKNAIIKDDEIFVIYERFGIFCLNIKTGKTKNWSKEKKINAKYFTDLTIHKDTFYIGTNAGVFKLTGNNSAHYSKTNGLNSNHINDLLIDHHGSLWVATQKGLNVLHKNTFFNIEKSIGQKSSTVKKLLEVDNYIYAAGNKGLFKFDNASQFKPKNNTKLLIEQNNSVFNINPINFINPKSIEIAYQLNNQNWITTTDKLLDFKNMKQGDYSLVLKYKDNLSTWKYSKKFNFNIRLPWYQQTWFYIILIFFLFSGFIALLVRVLKKSIQKNTYLKKTIKEKEELSIALKEVRKNVARDFHDELGNKLASISISSSLLLDPIYKMDSIKKEKKLIQIKKDADYLYIGMKDFVWSLDHKNDDILRLQVYLNDFGESLFENTNISFYSSHNLANSQTILPFYWSKQLVLIFKEAMTNTLKHSNASKVFLDFNLKKDNIIISFKDNGIGFSQKNIKRINGINNMKHRANTIHQKLIIKSKNGVSIIFAGNLKQNKNG